MPTCPYHGRLKPCRECLIKEMGQFAHAHPRGGVCPYHNKAHPCIDCFDQRMGQFAHPSGTPNPAPRAPAYIPPSRRAAPVHAHGNQRPCNIRCGVNEGLSIRNNQVNVTFLFTDSLANCTQVIFRNDTATFTCHIVGVAREPRLWINLIHGDFVSRYGQMTLCHVVTSDNPTAGLRIISYLELLGLELGHWPNCGGCAIRVGDGHMKATPPGWNTSQGDVAGWLTAQDLVDQRLTAPDFIGEASCGDYYELCQACNQ